MSLRIWLPLNGTLDNQGLDQITVTNNGATIDNNGKIGKCYSFDGNTSGININGDIIPTLAQGDFSTSFWVYNNDEGNRSIYMATIPSSNFGLGIQKTISEGLRIYWQGTPDYYPNLIIPVQEWCHIAVVIKSNNCYCYKNGILTASREDGSFTPQKLTNTWLYGMLGRDLRTGATVLKGKMNDFRWYDHALSPLEVKEISQGLILHYPLNRNGWGNDNILINTHFDSQTTKTSGWDTTKNGTQMASSWGGFNGGVPNPSTVYHAHLKQINNEWVYEYIRTADESWLGISQGGLQSKLVAGKTYTFSWEEYRVEGNNYPTGGLYYFKTGATSANFHLGQFGGSNGNVLGKWRKFSYTFVAPTDGDYSKNMSWYIYGQSGGNGKMYMRHPKLEEGSVATSWCPNSSDALATTMGLNDNIEYDTSGYCNNGTRTGTFSWTSDTPRYGVSTKFNGTEVIIAPITCGSISEAVTVACWGYESNWNVSTAERLLGAATSSSGWCIGDYSSENTLFAFYANGGYNVATGFKQLSAGWHHFVITFDGLNLIYYVDGQQFSKKTFSTKQVATGNYNINIGRHYGGGYNFKGNMSDVRIYATALSAEDVKSLYNNSAYIDNQGNIYGAVYEEV